jgi:hypothetical protein
MQIHNFHSKESRAALMLTLARILIVLVQLALAATMIDEARHRVEPRAVASVIVAALGSEVAT